MASRAGTRPVRGGRPRAGPHAAPSQRPRLGLCKLVPLASPGPREPPEHSALFGRGEPLPTLLRPFLANPMTSDPARVHASGEERAFRASRALPSRGSRVPGGCGSARPVPGGGAHQLPARWWLGRGDRTAQASAGLAKSPRDLAWPRRPRPSSTRPKLALREPAPRADGQLENLPRPGAVKQSRSKSLGEGDAAQACGALAPTPSATPPAWSALERARAGAPGPAGAASGSGEEERRVAREGRRRGRLAATALFARRRPSGTGHLRAGLEPRAGRLASPPRSPRRPCNPREETFSFSSPLPPFPSLPGGSFRPLKAFQKKKKGNLRGSPFPNVSPPSNSSVWRPSTKLTQVSPKTNRFTAVRKNVGEKSGGRCFPKCKTSERSLKRALLSLRNLHCCLANNGSLGDCGAVRMNRRSAGCVRVSAWGPGPKAPFSACHNKPEQGLVFTGSPAILYYSTLHNKKHLLISADQRPLLKQEKRGERGERER